MGGQQSTATLEAVPSEEQPVVARPSSRAFLRRHRVFGALLLLAIFVRALVVYAYWPAFWFQADSGTYIRRTGMLYPSDAANPIGYPLFLRMLQWTGSLATVSIVQHLLGLGLAVAIYALLRRRGLPGWLAALGCTPVLFDAHEIVLEHYLLSDLLFTVLLVSAVIALLWREQPSVLVCGIAGLLVFASMLTRTAGLAAGAVILAYLVLRRVGWRRCAMFAGVTGVLLGGYLIWADQVTGHARLAGPTERYLYSRTAGIADCSRLRLTAQQRTLCPTQPLGDRPMRGDYYLWNDKAMRAMPPTENPLIGSFATAVITQQTGDYAALIGRDTARYLVPGMTIDAGTRCLFRWWQMPANLVTNVPNTQRCEPLLASQTGFNSLPAVTTTNQHSRLRATLAAYSRWVTVPPALQGLLVMPALVSLCWRRRRPEWRNSRDAAMIVGTGLSLIVIAVATSMYDVRYGLTATVLFGLGGALAVHRLLPRRAPSQIDQVT